MSGAHIVCEYHLPFRNVGCRDTCVPDYQLGSRVGSSVAGKVVLTHSMLYHLSDKLATKVLVCLPISWVEGLETIMPCCTIPRYTVDLPLTNCLCDFQAICSQGHMSP